MLDRSAFDICLAYVVRGNLENSKNSRNPLGFEPAPRDLGREHSPKALIIGHFLPRRFAWTVIHAAMRAGELREKTDLEGQAVWLRIMNAIEELQSTDRGDASVN